MAACRGFYEHESATVGLPMRAPDHACPVLYALAGLTSNERTFAIKAGAQQHAAVQALLHPGMA